MSHWSVSISFWVVTLGLLVWFGAAWLCLANYRRSGRRHSVAWLEGLRFLLITLIVLTLLRPEWVRTVRRTEVPEVAVLLDASGSMRTRDVVAFNGVISRAEWITRQRATEFWKPWQKNGRVTVEEFSRPDTNAAPGAVAEEGTDLNGALEAVLQRQKNLKAVLLLTDGDWNSGKSPVAAATRFREAGIPIYSVAVGREMPVPDLVLESVSPPSYGLLGEQISIPYRLRNHLPRPVKTTLTLFAGTKEESRKEIQIPALGELQDSILWYPRAMGEAQLTLKVPVEKEEGLAENNEKSFRVSVRVETLKVLVVESQPRWEYRFLRNALARDPGVELQSVLFHPGMEAGGGNQYLKSFPGTKEQLSRYDVIFLGDVGIGEGELTPQDAQLIQGVVEQQSSGLVFLPGPRGRQLTLLNSALKELMPVVLDAAKPQGIGLQNESVLQLTTVGKPHLLTRFDPDENLNESIWRALPGFYWSAAVEKSRPGSEVLAVHSALRNTWGRIPLLVTRNAGSGKVLFMGTDSAWRWRRGVEDKFHYRFWSQVARWMSHQRHLSEKQGMRLSYSPETPQVGDTIFLQAAVLDAAGFPMERGEVVGRILSPGGREEGLELVPMEGGWGVYKGKFTPTQGGRYTVQLSAARQGRSLTTELFIHQPVREKLGQPINAEALRELSGISEGRSVALENFDQVLQQIAVLPEPKPIERRTRLWSDPWWGGTLVLLMGIYWTGRKLAGMI